MQPVVCIGNLHLSLFVCEVRKQVDESSPLVFGYLADFLVDERNHLPVPRVFLKFAIVRGDGQQALYKQAGMWRLCPDVSQYALYVASYAVGWFPPGYVVDAYHQKDGGRLAPCDAAEAVQYPMCGIAADAPVLDAGILE